MKVPRDLSGAQLVKILCRDWDYRIVHLEGSHIVRQTATPGHQRLSVPHQNTPCVGTLNAIPRTASAQNCVDRQTLLDSLR